MFTMRDGMSVGHIVQMGKMIFQAMFYKDEKYHATV